MNEGPREICINPIHLGLGAIAEIEPEFTGDPDWYEGYSDRHADDGVEGRLVTMHSFAESWDVWEMHPSGSEVVLCVAGEITLHQEHPDGTTAIVTLGSGEYVINPPGTWHTADVEDSVTALFITAGAGTEHRSRDLLPTSRR
jgi:mannose-6-phosphate isomerase-like protein (cupin superfamily)